MNRRGFLTLTAAGGVTAVLGPGRSAWASAPSAGKAGYGVASIDPVYAMVYVALKKGYFADAGVTVDYLNAQSGPRAKQMLAANQIFAATTGVNDSVALAVAGRPSVLVAGFDTRIPFANVLVSKKLYDAGLTSIEQLAGRTIGITQPQSATWLMAVYMADKAGIKDKIDIRPLGDFATMLGAVKSGSVDACTATAAMLGMGVSEGWGAALFDVTDEPSWNRLFGGDVPGVGCYVLQDSIDKRPEAVQAIVTGLVRATDDLAALSPDEIAELIHADYLQGYSLQAATDAITIFKRTWSRDNLITAEHYGRLMDIMRDRQLSPTDMQKVPYEKAVDMRFVQKARNL